MRGLMISYLETSVFQMNLSQLMARENFIESSRESFRLHVSETVFKTVNLGI
jgi:hypothetical protein